MSQARLREDPATVLEFNIGKKTQIAQIEANMYLECHFMKSQKQKADLGVGCPWIWVVDPTRPGCLSRALDSSSAQGGPNVHPTGLLWGWSWQDRGAGPGAGPGRQLGLPGSQHWLTGCAIPVTKNSDGPVSSRCYARIFENQDVIITQKFF